MSANHLHYDVLSISKLVDNYITWKQVNNPDGGKRKFVHYHPSSFGHCLRMLQYQKYEDEGLFSVDHPLNEPALVRIWENGHDMHNRWRRYFEDLNILRGYWKCLNSNCLAYDDNGNLDASKVGKVKERRIYGTDHLIGCFKPQKCICGCQRFHYEEISVKSEEMNLEGHCDAVLDFSNFDVKKWGDGILKDIDKFPEKPVVIDMKSINHFGFQEVAKGVPGSHYVIQLIIYTNILDCEFGMLWYENKNNQRTTYFKIDRNEELWNDIKKASFEMNEMSLVTDEDGNKLNLLPPPKPFYQSDEECEKCLYKEICHNSSIWEEDDLSQIRQSFYGKMV